MDSSNRIPADKVSGFAAWDMPEVKEGLVVRAEATRRRDSTGQAVEVDKNQVLYQQVTIGQMDDIKADIYQEISAPARQEGYHTGREEGYKTGYKEGSAKALAEGQQLIQQQAQGLKGAIAPLMDVLAFQDDQFEQALVNMAVTLASSVLKRELKIDSSQILSVVHDSIASLPLGSSNITVFLNEQDLQRLQTHSDIPEQWQLQQDAGLTPGGCRVTSDHSIVEYTLEDQFQQTVNAMVEDRFAELAQKAHERLSDEEI